MHHGQDQAAVAIAGGIPISMLAVLGGPQGRGKGVQVQIEHIQLAEGHGDLQ